MDQKITEAEITLNYKGQNTLGYDINELLKAKFTLEAIADLERAKPKKQRKLKIKKQSKIESLQPPYLHL